MALGVLALVSCGSQASKATSPATAPVAGSTSTAAASTSAATPSTTLAAATSSTVTPNSNPSKSTLAEPAPTGTIVVDATTIATPRAERLVEFGPIAVGDLTYRLDRAPDSTMYFIGQKSFNDDTMLVDIFDLGVKKSTRYEIPESFRRKNADGSARYNNWMLGPDRVLYAQVADIRDGATVAIIAVPTTGPKASQVAARVSVGDAFPCVADPRGMRCATQVILPWIAADGSPLGKSFEGDWYDFAKAHNVVEAAPGYVNGSAAGKPTTVTLANDTKVTFDKMQQAIGGGTNQFGTRGWSGTFDGKQCAFGNVAWESTGTTFATCIGADGKAATTRFAAASGSLPGGSIELMTDGAFYTVEQTGTGSTLVRYTFA
jgi:hypothetical protein